MASIHFTNNLRRHVDCQQTTAGGATVAEVLAAVFLANPRVRSYVLDDQGELRKHMAIFVDGQQLRDRIRLSDAVNSDTEIYIMQALSGG